MAVDYTQLLDGLNTGLQALAQDALTFPVAEELPPIAPANRVTFDKRNVPLPAPLYLARDDGLQVDVWNSAFGARVEFSGRFLRQDGSLLYLSESFAPTTDRQQSTLTLNLGEGFLLNAALHEQVATVQRGQEYGVLSLTQGSGVSRVQTTVLIANYLSHVQPQGWPGGELANPLSGRGATLEVTPNLSGGGVLFSQTVPTNARWHVRAARFSFVFLGVVGNRYAYYQVNPGDGQVFITWTAADIPAGAFGTCMVQHWGAVPPQFVNAFYPLNLPLAPSWPAGATIQFGMGSTGAGDAVSNGRLMVEEWIDI